MSDSKMDVDHLRSWIGREDVAQDIVSLDLARKYHAMFDYPTPPPKMGDVLPRLIHFCVAQPTVATKGLGPDGHPTRGGFLPPVPLPRRMWAGGALTFTGDLRVGDTMRRTSRIEDVQVKEGRTGVLCFVTVNHKVDAGGTPIIDERQDIVYRAMETGGGPAKSPPANKTPPAAEQGQHQRPMRAETPLLFRYSAVTFNAHRIHYDRPYVTQVEGYPGLVVHGPMQAAWMCDYATELRGTPPTRYSFRGQSPLFDHDDFALHATENGDSMKLWTAKKDGTLCMSAEASWA